MEPLSAVCHHSRRDEEGCVASTVEHLFVELRLRGIPHEIVVVDDGSTDNTWKALVERAANESRLSRPSKPWAIRFWANVVLGLDQSTEMRSSS